MVAAVGVVAAVGTGAAVGVAGALGVGVLVGVGAALTGVCGAGWRRGADITGGVVGAGAGGARSAPGGGGCWV
jgi:hypothetical protein